MTSPLRPAAPLEAYRIGDPAGRWPVYSPNGARQVSGRWHERGDRVIYASEHYSTAMLETLVRWSGLPPRDQHLVRIDVPAGTSYEVIEADDLPDWHLPDSGSARRAGQRWYADSRSAILIVPSVVARVERNVIINADHPEFPKLRPGPETPVWWDERLCV
ncbi:RES family NAD+ phosphorylase [Candidatus Palauibacter sp.]|uniref:RES family NAD+ phosphorylase n=1 Tax=Candidatus Palauibacter sp. TaxID=3101350 RepID=UPI003C6F0827